MGSHTPERNRPYRLAWSANDVFKARWQARVNWSTMAAVGLHAVLFLWFPTWKLARLSPGSTVETTGIELVALDEGAQSPGGALRAAIVVGDDAEPPPEEPDPDDGSGPSESDLGGATERLREELRRRTAPRPVVVEPETEVAPEDDRRTAAEEAEEEDGEGTQIGGGYSLSEFETLTEDERLALERLSTLRPELAFTSPSSWILLRNPSEVGDFLEERFGASSIGPGARGALSVAIWVDEQGSVEWAEITRSSGDQDLDESALELFKEVVSFRPARQGGVRVPMAVIFWLPYRW